MVHSLWKYIGRFFFLRIHLQLPYHLKWHSWPFISWKWKHVHTNIYTQLFIIALFSITKTWKLIYLRKKIEWLNKLFNHLYREILLSNKNKLNTDTHNSFYHLKVIKLNIESQPEKSHSVWFHSYNILGMTELYRWGTR